MGGAMNFRKRNFRLFSQEWGALTQNPACCQCGAATALPAVGTFVKVSNLSKVWGQYVKMPADIYYRKHERVMS